MSRWTKLWVAVAALAVTALLVIAADKLAFLGMHVFLAAQRGQSWLPPLAITSSTFLVFFVVFLGIAVRRRRARTGYTKTRVMWRG